MKEDITRLFDKITPIRSDDKIIANVIGKAENMEEKNTKRSKGFRKPLIAACAAVTVLAVGTVAVGAANNWDYASLLTNFFSGRAIQNQSSLQNGFDFEKYGMVIDKTVENSDFTLKFHGIAADESTAIIVLDVIINDIEGKVAELASLNATATPMVSSSKSYIIDHNENSFTIAVYFSSDTEIPDDVINFRFNTLYYDLMPDDGSTDVIINKTLNIDETIKIDMGSFNRSTDMKTINPEHIYDMDEYELELTEIRITPFRICYELKVDKEQKQAIWEDGCHKPFENEISIMLADGNEMQFRGGVFGGGNEETMIGEKNFSYPINTDDVVSVTIAGVTYDLTNN